MRTPLILGLFLLLGCHRAAPARQPVVQVPVDCECDDYDIEWVRIPKPVEYVRLNDWTPPPSAQRVEAEIERTPGEPAVTPYPKLTLHAPVGSTTIRTVPRGFYTGEPWLPPYRPGPPLPPTNP